MPVTGRREKMDDCYLSDCRRAVHAARAKFVFGYTQSSTADADRWKFRRPARASRRVVSG